jgi:hypothetical protein
MDRIAKGAILNMYRLSRYAPFVLLLFSGLVVCLYLFFDGATQQAEIFMSIRPDPMFMRLQYMKGELSILPAVCAAIFLIMIFWKSRIIYVISLLLCAPIFAFYLSYFILYEFDAGWKIPLTWILLSYYSLMLLTGMVGLFSGRRKRGQTQ